MTVGYAAALGCCLVALIMLIHLMRRGRLQEKYAAIWIVVVLGVCIVGAFPEVLFGLSNWLGFATPSNLLFAIAFVVVFLISIQVSSELSVHQDRLRDIAEEVGLLRLEVDRLRRVTAECDDESGRGVG